MSKTGRKAFGTTDIEREVIDKVRLMSRRVKGGRVPTLRSIADRLNAAGYLTKSGKRFRPQTVAAIQERIASGQFKAKPKRTKKTQLTSSDFRSEEQIRSDIDALGKQGSKELRQIYSILLGTGLRASELCDLRCGDVDLSKRMVNVRRGKGAKQRSIIISRNTCSILLHLVHGKPKRQPVLMDKYNAELSYDALRARGKKIAEIIGDPSWHLHCMRHTFATRLYNYKKDINFVAEQLGHSSIETTRIYAKTLTSEKLEQMDAMDSLGKLPDESASAPETTSKTGPKP
jgi:integrase